MRTFCLALLFLPLAHAHAAIHTTTPAQFAAYAQTEAIVLQFEHATWAGNEYANGQSETLYFDRKVGFHLATKRGAGAHAQHWHFWKDASGCHVANWTDWSGLVVDLEQSNPVCEEWIRGLGAMSGVSLRLLLGSTPADFTGCQAQSTYLRCDQIIREVTGKTTPVSIALKSGYLDRTVSDDNGQYLRSTQVTTQLRKPTPQEITFDVRTLPVTLKPSPENMPEIWAKAEKGDRLAMQIALAAIQLDALPAGVRPAQYWAVLQRAYAAKIPNANSLLSRFYSKAGLAYLPASERKMGNAKLRMQFEKLTLEAMRSCNFDVIQYLQEGCFEQMCDDGNEQPKKSVAFGALAQEKACEQSLRPKAYRGKRPAWVRIDFGVKP